jgi:histidinol dehydrogenase
MKVIQNPAPSTWASLCERPEFERAALTSTVSDILKEVKSTGDKALLEYAERFDGVKLTSILVSEEEKVEASKQVSTDLKAAIQTAYDNIYSFHKGQQKEEESIETTPGVRCWRRSLPIEKVGLYIPGGSAPLFSTILMLGIPASIAGCKEMVLCTPPGKDGKVHPAILYTAQLVGITTICKVGGAQAVGAMAYGTQSVPQVYKIFGPGNQYVTKAKEIVQVNGTAIDMPAGPSEVLVIADETCQPSFVAADLLSQAEHGADSQVILLSPSKAVIDTCISRS